MRIPSGVTDQYIYFVAVDSTDYVTRETGLSSFTVYRSRNGAAAAAMTTPTINETDATNMQGVYELLLDEDMTIGAGNDSEEMVLHITHTGMAPVTRTIELYRPKITAGETLTVSGGLASANTTQIEGSDATDQIRDAVVDDATRIDASALNTASSAIGSDGSGLTEAGGTGDHLSAIPWNSAWDAEVQSECNDALVALGLDHLVSTSVTGADIANNSVMARLVSASVTADWDDFVNTTDSLQAIRDRGDAAWITAVGFSSHSAADVRTEMDSNSTQLTAIVADTNELQTDWANGGRLDLILDARASQASLDALNNVSVSDIWTTALTESYAADGATITGAQGLYEIVQSIGEMAISGTTITVKQRDGNTTAATYTLNDGTNPTSRTRAT